MSDKRPLPVACFAPPLTDELLAQYRQQIDAVTDAELKSELDKCYACVAAWWELPVSAQPPTARTALMHRTDPAAARREIQVAVTPLEPDHVHQLWDVTPWMRELNTLSNGEGTGLFDSLPAGDLRNAAFHLLWHCKEITLDREPMTNNRLPV